MVCPNCKKPILDKAILLNVEVDYCTKCQGLWFDDDELRIAKDKEDVNLNWLDIDLWRDIKKFIVSRTGRLCPYCRMPLYEAQYDNSKVRVDPCNLCKGIWLDKKEFERIIKYLKEKADYEVLYHFSKNLIEEMGEVFIGPEKIKEEVLDLLTLLKLLHYKFSIQHPYLTTLIKGLLPK